MLTLGDRAFSIESLLRAAIGYDKMGKVFTGIVV
jgi:hypothetical protein